MEFKVAPQDRIFKRNHTFKVGGNLVDTRFPRVMGIINVTPDSFYDGGKANNDREILNRAEQHLSNGAFCLDVGGYSTRPGAESVDEKTEKKRVLHAVSLITEHFPEAVVSVDTFRTEVARACLDAGAHMINDVSGGSDRKMPELIAEYGVPYIMMHIPGDTESMHEKPDYDDVTRDVIQTFARKVTHFRDLGVADIILDPGFGFGKTPQQNVRLIKELDKFHILECPLLVGVSRKSTIQKILNVDASRALNGTTVLNTIALMNGAALLRVHDVREAVEAITLVEHLQNAKT